MCFDISIPAETGFTYQGFCFHLGGAGDNCDDVCTSHGSTNEALAASGVVVEEDCTIIDHFDATLGLGLGSPATSNPYWHFGYFYTTGTSKWCPKYGSDNDGSGVRVGETQKSGGSTRRFICACSGTIQ